MAGYCYFWVGKEGMLVDFLFTLLISCYFGNVNNKLFIQHEINLALLYTTDIPEYHRNAACGPQSRPAMHKSDAVI